MGKRNENKRKMVRAAGGFGYIIAHKSHLSKDRALRLYAKKDDLVQKMFKNLLVSLTENKKHGARRT